MLVTPKKCPVFSLHVHLSEDYPTWVIDRLENNLGTHIVTLNSEMVILGEKTPKVAEIIEQAELVIPDGAGVVIYLRLRGHQQERVPGIELAETLIEKVAKKGTIAFYGGKAGVIEAATKKWKQAIPCISLITNHGYLSAQEQEDWQNTLSIKQPKLILVGLGVPGQEYWISKHRHLCPNSIWIGVGGSFDIWSGQKMRAPLILRENNLEWLYRLYQEPWRWRRMLSLPVFFLRSFIHKDL